MATAPTPELDHLIAGYRRFRAADWTQKRERWRVQSVSRKR